MESDSSADPDLQIKVLYIPGRLSISFLFCCSFAALLNCEFCDFLRFFVISVVAIN